MKNRLAGTVLLLAVVIAVAGAGCDQKSDNGQNGQATQTETEQVSDDQAASDVVVAYFTALAERNAQNACNQLSPNAQAQLEQVVPIVAKGSCLATMEGYVGAFSQADLDKARNVKVTSTQVTGDAAVVQFEGGTQPVNLTKIDGQWKIANFNR